MLASVVIACYNHERYLSRCLASVARQEHQDIELILIDDVSQDGSYQLAQSIARDQRFASRFKRIIVEQNAVNLGAAATWNRALSLVNGELIFLLNSDDYYLESRISTFASDWNNHPFYFAYSPVLPVDDAGRPVATSLSADLIYRPQRLALQLPELSWALLEFNATVTTGNFVFTRQLFDQVGGFSDLKYCHDWCFALEAATLVEPRVVTGASYFYRLHANNSFRELTARAEIETRACYQTYADRAMTRRPINPLCPSPHNQGPAFWSLVELMPAFSSWVKREYLPYRAYHRTIADTPHTRRSLVR